jgi:uracil-DNA glycosylase
MSLDLDHRQRAMLQEMGVQVWWPQAPEVEVLPVAKTLPISQPARPALPAQTLVAAQKIDAVAPRIAPPIAIKNIASPAYSVGVSGQKDTQNRLDNVAELGWQALQQSVSNCRACQLCEGRTSTVFGVGQVAPQADVAPQVDWLVVGEAPGENEDRTGEPFVGQAGQLLDNMLKAMGVSRSQNVFIVNVVKCRPPGNRNPQPDEIAQCEPYLKRQIELLQPKMILAMGRFAAHALLHASHPDIAKLPLGKQRGQVHHYTNHSATGEVAVPVVVTYHPAYLLRSLTEKAKAWADLCMAMAQLRPPQ